MRTPALAQALQQRQGRPLLRELPGREAEQQSPATATSLPLTVTPGGVTYSSIHTSNVGLVIAAGTGTIGDGISDATTSIEGGAFAASAVNGKPLDLPNAQVDLTTTGDGAFVSSLAPRDIGGVDMTLHSVTHGDSQSRLLASFTSTYYFVDVCSLPLGPGETQSLMWSVQFSEEVATATPWPTPSWRACRWAVGSTAARRNCEGG